MRTYKYFADRPDGSVLELPHVFDMDNQTFELMFPGEPARRMDSFSRMVGTPAGKPVRHEHALPVTRSIAYSTRPSRHRCDARCMNARGNNCECSCGGANHGRHA